MNVIDLEEWPYIAENQSEPMLRLREKLRELSNGDELTLLRFTDKSGNERQLILAPMSRVEITLK